MTIQGAEMKSGISFKEYFVILSEEAHKKFIMLKSAPLNQL